MDVTKVNNITYTPGEINKINNHVEVCYLKPYVGELYSPNNCIEFINENNEGCVSGDLVKWTQNSIETDHFTKEGFVRIKLPENVKLARGDQFECVTKSPFLVNDKIKFHIIACKKTGFREFETNYCEEARRLMEII